MKTLLVALVAFNTLAVCHAAPNKTAGARATCLSIVTPPYARSISGAGTVTSYFTTFDGVAGVPLHDVQAGGGWLISDEFRPRLLQSGIYECDYFNESSILGNLGYGSVVAALPTSDEDANGIPDFQQIDRGGTFPWTGNIFPDSSASSQLTGTVAKAVNSDVLQMNYGAYRDGILVESFNQTASLYHFEGTLTYNRSSSSLSLSVTGPTSPSPFFGTASFSVISEDQLAVPQFTLYRQDGKHTTLYPFTFRRDGTKYIARVSISDGNTDTSWRDFAEWVFEILDPNDGDGDGIPDLSDTPPAPPAITLQPSSLNLGIGSNGIFSVSVDSVGTTTYQWFFKNRTLPGMTGPALTVSATNRKAVGDYFVEIKNDGGTTRSGVVTMTRWKPLRIVIQPRPKIVTAGKTIILIGRAVGSTPVAYQWFKDSVAIPNATARKLVLPDAQATNSGMYYFTALNIVSVLTSSAAVVTVNP